MTPRAPSATYLARARALADAIDVGVELSAALPVAHRDALVTAALAWKEMALAPRPGFATTRSLAFLEQAFFEHWNHASGAHVERFWQALAERGLPFARKDLVRDVLARGRIKNEVEYEAVTDAMVVQRQLGRISAAEEETLGEMLAAFEKRAKRPGSRG